MRSELFIDGDWVATGNSLPVINPATEQVVHHIPAGSAADAHTAVRAARRANDLPGPLEPQPLPLEPAL